MLARWRRGCSQIIVILIRSDIIDLREESIQILSANSEKIE